MLLGARQFFERRGAPAWTNPYVTDGLVAMWDGEWNAGGGVHDASATVWKDIVGGVEIPVASVGDNYVTLGYTLAPQLIISQILGGSYTYEHALTRTSQVTGAVDYFTTDLGDLLQWQYTSSSSWCRLPFGGITSLGGSVLNEVDVMAQSLENGNAALYGNGVVKGTSAGISSVGTTFSRSAVQWEQSNIISRLHRRISIYSRALTAEEVAHNYAKDKERFNLP